MDLDCDSSHRPDNALGNLIVAVMSHADEYDLDAEMQALIDAGKLLHLIQVTTTSWDQASGVGVSILHAEDLDDDPSDNLTGQEEFAIDETRGSGLTTGRVEHTLLSGEFGTAPVAVTFPGLDDVFLLHLYGVRVEIQQTEDGIAGRIGGAVSAEEVDTKVIPVFQEGLSRIIERDCEESDCVEDSFGGLLLALFDQNQDGMVDVEELRSDSLVSSLTYPDLDLLDSDGSYSPRTDGINDSMSVALQFTAVGASFPPQ